MQMQKTGFILAETFMFFRSLERLSKIEKTNPYTHTFFAQVCSSHRRGSILRADFFFSKEYKINLASYKTIFVQTLSVINFDILCINHLQPWSKNYKNSGYLFLIFQKLNLREHVHFRILE